jgi:hypothetical protein
MDENEKPEDVKKWFISEAERLWPVSSGSLSLRKNKCIRPNCSACLTEKGHPSYALHTRYQGSQTSIYIPDDLAGEISRAVENGRELKELLVVAGRRYVKALKAERKKR